MAGNDVRTVRSVEVTTYLPEDCGPDGICAKEQKKEEIGDMGFEVELS